MAIGLSSNRSHFPRRRRIVIAAGRPGGRPAANPDFAGSSLRLAKLDDAVAHGEDGGLDAVVEAQSFKQVRYVKLDH
jgi:hypothetical protein